MQTSSARFLLHPIILVAVFIRLVFFGWHIDSIIGNRKEIVTPITDFKRVTEGIFLSKLGLSPYDGDAFHQPPLILPIFAALDNVNLSKLVFVAADILLALVLRQITSLWQKQHTIFDTQHSTKKDSNLYSTLSRENLPDIVAALYLFNPFTIATCVGMSTIIFNNLAVILSLYYALQGNAILSTFSVAVASYLSIYPVILLFPIHLLLRKQTSLLSLFIMFGAFAGSLLLLSFSLVQSWDFIDDTYLFALQVRDLTPNIGLFWYFFIEVFKHFQNFYLFAYQYHVFIYALPLYFRLGKHPFVMFWINVATIAAFKAYPALGDLALQLALLPLIADELRSTQYTFVVGIVAVFVVVLAPIFWWMWIYAGTGNANFYYAINLALTMGQVMLITDAVGAVLKDDYLAKKEAKKALAEKAE